MITCRNLCQGYLEDDETTVVLSRNSSWQSIQSQSVQPMKKDAWGISSLSATSELWELSEEEQKNLALIGQRVADIDYIMNAPGELIRFVRARPNNLEAAEEMFRKMVAWRIENDVDNELDRRPKESFLNHVPGAILKGRDKEGDPIFVNRSGLLDATGLVKHFGPQALIQYTIWIRELVSRGEWRKDAEAERGKPFTRILIIEDLKSFALTKFIRNPSLVSLYGEMMHIDQNFYPEGSKKIIVIRTPSLFRVVWKLIKGFFDPYVVEKLEFCGDSDLESCLSKYLDLSLLPEAVMPGIGKGMAEKGMPEKFDGGTVHHNQ